MRAFLSFLFVFYLAGCTTIGPQSLVRDRFDYNKAVSDSWKEQTLLNIVKLRYADMPLFMEVASIVSGYSMESTVDLGGTFYEGGSVPNVGSVGATGRYTDRPTITYSPITGSDFNKTFLTPIPPGSVLFMIQAGWPADIVLPITVEAINGLRAQRSPETKQRIGQEGFYRVIELVTELQRAGAIGMRVEKGDDTHDTVVLVIRRTNLSPEILVLEDELAKWLTISPDAAEYTVAFAEIARNDTELAMLTRSTLGIMLELAAQVSVPPRHSEEGRTLTSLADAADSFQEQRRLIDIRSSKERPEDAFVQVKYRDHWFWIDDRDIRSKRTLAYLMLLFSLTESGGKEGLPLVTIPAG